MTAINAQGLTKYYGNNRGIEDVSLTVGSGEIFGFIGPNGAGKSTMIRTLMGMIFPSGGSAEVLGHDCVKDSHIIKRSVGYVPCEVRFYEDLTVKQMLKYSDSFYGTADPEYTKELIGRFGLEPGKKMGELSSGNKKKAAIVAALSPKPKLLILDEPTSGLDPLVRRTLFEALREQQEKGATVFLSSHNLDEVQTLCGRAAIIRQGRIADVRSMKAMEAGTGKKITLKGKSLGGELKDAQVISSGDGSLVFLYRSEDMQKLRSMLCGLEFDDILIEDEKLSDVFMSYYGGDGAVQRGSGA